MRGQITNLNSLSNHEIARLRRQVSDLKRLARKAPDLFALGVGSTSSDEQNRTRCIDEARALLAEFKQAAG